MLRINSNNNHIFTYHGLISDYKYDNFTDEITTNLDVTEGKLRFTKIKKKIQNNSWNRHNKNEFVRRI